VVGRTQPRAVRASRVAIVAAAVRLEPTVPVIDERTTKGTPSGKTDAHQRLAIQSQSPDTLEKVQSIIAEQLGTDVESVGPAAKFVDLGADSLDTVRERRQSKDVRRELSDVRSSADGSDRASTMDVLDAGRDHDGPGGAVRHHPR